MKRARPKASKIKLKKEVKQKDKVAELELEDSLVVGEEAEQPEKKKNKNKRKNKKPKKKKTVLGVIFTIFKVLLSLIAVLVILLLVAMGFGWFEEGELLAPIENGRVNVLILGVDEEGQRSDTIMIASYNTEEGKINILSIPRDTKVHIENRNITRKINEVHALSSKQKKGEIVGAQATAEAVTQLTGIPINYYVEFSFAAIDNLFDILGPVEFDVPDVEGKGRGMNYDDPAQNLHIHLKPGRQMLSGNQIQQFLRYRKSNYGVGTGSDTDRVERQQNLIRAVIDQKVNLGILLKAPSIFSQISKDIKTNVQLGDITKYIRHIARLSGDGIQAYTLPGESATIGGGSYFVMNKEETKKLIGEVFGFEGEPTDDITVSYEHSQEILKGGNKGKEPKATPKQTLTPVKTPSTSGKPANTPAPTVKPTNTNTPLEDLDDEVITLD